MTETVSGATGTGLKIERVFSTDGVHPYDEITWERRDVVQTNWKTGEAVFEQRGVEYPDFWSANASTIVTTKYFRGALGSDVREWSLKQLIDRVVSTYRKGRGGTYRCLQRWQGRARDCVGTVRPSPRRIPAGACAWRWHRPATRASRAAISKG